MYSGLTEANQIIYRKTGCRYQINFFLIYIYYKFILQKFIIPLEKAFS